MLFVSLLLFFLAAVFSVFGVLIRRGRLDLIHDYHRTNVTDPVAYSKAFGLALMPFAVGMLLGGVLFLPNGILPAPWPAFAVLMAGVVCGIVCLVLVQRKYNKGIF